MDITDDYIALRDVNKFYTNDGESVGALQNVSLSIDKGEFVAIIGRSGSGKTTLMNVIGCLDDITSGEFYFSGLNLGQLNEDEIAVFRNQHIGFVFQKYNLLPYLSALENVSLPAIYTPGLYSNRTERAYNILNSVGMAGRCNFNPNQLSGGQQQRVSIARSLMNDAEIILADEPTGALDSATGEQVIALLKELHNKGKTIILVTHDRHIAAQAERIISMCDGRIVKDERLTNNKRRPVVNKYNVTLPSGILIGIVESFRTAFRSLNGHRIRSVLSMLGVIIGIFAVLTSVAISEGAHRRILNDMNLLDANTIEIRPGQGWNSIPGESNDTLVKEDLDMLSDLLPTSKISPVMATSATLNVGNSDMDITLTGVSNEYLQEKKLLSGYRFQSYNVSDSDAVIIIESRLAQSLFGSSDAAPGKIVQVSGYPFLIVGVVQDTASQSVNSPLKAWVPWTSYINRITGVMPFQALQVRVKNQSEVANSRDKIEQALRLAHGKKDFFTVTDESMAEMIGSVSTSMKLLTVAISTISLIVGGVGVMNIMLVSVTERVHEIGIRLSVGARPADIKRQFLIESVSICLLGGCGGIVLTVLLSIIFPLFTEQFSMVITLMPVIFACTFSIVIGVMFGYIPAKIAASYKPARALGYK